MSTIQLKRGTTSSWTSQNPVLADGQPGVETTSSGTRLKIGDGTSDWSELKYVGAGQYLPLSGGMMTGQILYSYTFGMSNPNTRMIYCSGADLTLGGYQGISVYNSSGSYGTISNVRTPTSDYQAANKLYVDTQVNSKANNVNMKGATSSTAGTAGLVPAPAAGKQTSFLRGDGTWVIPTDTNTTYSAGTGLSLSGTTFNHQNYGKATTYGSKSGGNVSVRYNNSTSSVAVPYITTNSQGHVTGGGLSYVYPEPIIWNENVTLTQTTNNGSRTLTLDMKVIMDCFVICRVNGTLEVGTTYSITNTTIGSIYRPEQNIVTAFPGFSGGDQLGFVRLRIGSNGAVTLNLDGKGATGLMEVLTTLCWATVSGTPL